VPIDIARFKHHTQCFISRAFIVVIATRFIAQANLPNSAGLRCQFGGKFTPGLAHVSHFVQQGLVERLQMCYLFPGFGQFIFAGTQFRLDHVAIAAAGGKTGSERK
jgi:hypothetical protein